MNYIKSDLGKLVISEGSPCSVKRMEVEHPLLISQLRTLNRYDVEEILKFKKFSRLEIDSLMIAAGFAVA